MTAPQQIVIREGRLLPGLIACFAFAVCAVILSLAADAASYGVGIGMALFGIWPAYRVLRPRWILHLEHGSLRFKDIPKRQTVAMKLTRDAAVRYRPRAISGVGAEGGIGFWHELVIHSDGRETVLRLPFLDMSVSKVCALIREVTPKEKS
jgi:hypothetical protein